MAKYKVIGECVVGGVAPGGTVDLDLPEANIEALIRAGNVLAPVPPAPAAKTPKVVSDGNADPS